LLKLFPGEAVRPINVELSRLGAFGDVEAGNWSGVVFLFVGDNLLLHIPY